MKESPSLNAYVKWSLCLSACSDSWFYFLFDTRNLQISIRETKNIQLICVIHHEHITSLKVWGFGWMVEHTFSWIGRTNLNESFLLNVLLSFPGPIFDGEHDAQVCFWNKSCSACVWMRCVRKFTFFALIRGFHWLFFFQKNMLDIDSIEQYECLNTNQSGREMIKIDRERSVWVLSEST